MWLYHLTIQHLVVTGGFILFAFCLYLYGRTKAERAIKDINHIEPHCYYFIHPFKGFAYINSKLKPCQSRRVKAEDNLYGPYFFFF